MAAGVVVGGINEAVWASLLGVVGSGMALEGVAVLLEGAFWNPWTEFAMSKYRITRPAKIPSARV